MNGFQAFIILVLVAILGLGLIIAVAPRGDE